MDEYITDFLKASPGIAGVIVVVIVFLRAQAKRDESFTQLHKEHLEERRSATVMVAKCNESIGAVHETNCRVADTNERIVKLLDDIYRGDGTQRR